ncbi:glycosyltransferase family 2 protein [Gillisia sp. CAL575]|uniref:glycosyltransferase family 2 protein n=1 Tax=Gillisia sp. CAL575 TaxID=985255 RepID=UPI0003A0ABB7|nr:glycosyltransferase [Gillisia sp. CAL575]
MDNKAEENIVVSICCLAYNHEAFISKCLDGFLVQKTLFAFEVLINDDASTDRTSTIIKEYENKYPKIIKPIYQSVNRFSVEGGGMNIRYNFSRAKGKYIAMCEGDDYWTNPFKLQNQVDFLEANSNYVIHSGKAKVLMQNELNEIIGNPLSKNTYDITDFLTKNNLITCTVLFRNTTVLEAAFKNLMFGDWMLYVQLLSKKSGNLAYVSNDLYSVYRMHEGGVTQSLIAPYKNDKVHLRQIIAIKRFLKVNYQKEDIIQINYYCLNLFKYYFINRDYKNCFKIFLHNFWLTKPRLQIRKYLSFIKHN